MATQGVPLEITCYHSAGTVVLRLSGQVDLNAVPVLQGELAQGLSVIQDDCLVIDTTDLEFLDASGVEPTPPSRSGGESHTVRVIPQAGPIDARVLELLELGSLLAGVPPAKNDSPRGRSRARSPREPVRGSAHPDRPTRGGTRRSVKSAS
jgi:hypothetical protein